MFLSNERDNRRLLILALGLGLGLVLIAQVAEVGLLISGSILGFIVAGIIVTHPKVGLFLLVPSILLSPTFAIGQLPFRPIELRLEDGILLCLAIGILVDHVRDRRSQLKLPELTIPVAFVVLTTFISFLNGVLFQQVNSLQSLLYVLKFAEYSFIFVVIVTLVRTKEQFQYLLVVFLGTAFLISFSSIVQAVLHFTTPLNLAFQPFGRTRFTGLFTGPTVYGAFNALIVPVALSLSLQSRHQPLRLFSGAVAIVAFVALLLSAARGGFVGVLAGLGTIVVVLAIRGRGPVSRLHLLLSFALMSGLLLCVILLGSVLGIGFLDRFLTLFVSPLQQPGVQDRVAKWLRFLLEDFVQNPVLGAGIANAPWYNSYYVRLLVEQGLLTFAAFSWFVVSLLRRLVELQRSYDGIYTYFALGVLGSTVSFLVLNIPAEMFIVARTVQPFWFLVGLAVTIPFLETENNQPGESDTTHL